MKTTYYNRYGDNIQFELINENEIEMTGYDSSYMRYGHEGSAETIYDNLVYVDPPGGPFLMKGTNLGTYFNGTIGNHFIQAIKVKNTSVLFTTKKDK